MAIDLFQYPSRNNDSSSPSRDAAAVTPSDTVDLTQVTKGLYVGGAGDVTVTMVDNPTPVTFRSVPVGSFLPVRVSRVMATNTSATLIVAMF